MKNHYEMIYYFTLYSLKLVNPNRGSLYMLTTLR